MKRLKRLFLTCLAIGMLLMVVTACQSGTSGPRTADSGLVPDMASTGAPPLIPHEVEESDGGEECLGCHEVGDHDDGDHDDGDHDDGDHDDGDHDDGEDAPKIPEWHATLTDCRQCHVPFVEGGATFKTQY